MIYTPEAEYHTLNTNTCMYRTFSLDKNITQPSYASIAEILL